MHEGALIATPASVTRLNPVLAWFLPVVLQAQAPSGAQVLKWCQQAYDSATTLQEDVAATMSTNNLTATARITFKRPGKLTVYGRSIFGAPYGLLSFDGLTWVKNGPMGWTSQNSPEMGIATVTGVSGNAAMSVPAALFHTSWGGFAGDKPKGPATLTELKGRKVYLVTSGGSVPRKYWIDADTHFLVLTELTAMKTKITVRFGPVKMNRPISDKEFRRK